MNIKKKIRDIYFSLLHKKHETNILSKKSNLIQICKNQTS